MLDETRSQSRLSCVDVSDAWQEGRRRRAAAYDPCLCTRQLLVFDAIGFDELIECRRRSSWWLGAATLGGHHRLACRQTEEARNLGLHGTWERRSRPPRKTSVNRSENGLTIILGHGASLIRWRSGRRRTAPRHATSPPSPSAACTLNSEYHCLQPKFKLWSDPKKSGDHLSSCFTVEDFATH